MLVLNDFSTISLEELKERSSLLKRHETKYLIDKGILLDVLETLKNHYDILAIGPEGNQNKIFTYESCYFDSECRWSYRQHHQGKRLRAKVRTRAYLDSDDMTYFEVKLKKWTQTFKYRLPIDREEHGTIGEQSQQFMQEKYSKLYKQTLEHSLSPLMSIRYKRITLVHKTDKERLTIDIWCTFDNDSKSFVLENSVIMESKSDKINSASKQILKSHGIWTIGSCSKYCLWNIVLNGVKYNRFKGLMKKIGKIEKKQ